MGIIKPLYGVEDAINKIAEVDEKINELLIERAGYVEAYKQEINKKG